MRRGDDPAWPVVLTREQARAVDAAAESELGIPGLVLMENAAAALESVAWRMLDRLGEGPALVLVVCGGGNNGGDGSAMARRMRVRAEAEDADVRAESVGVAARGAIKGDALTNRVIAERMGLVAPEDGTGDWGPLRDRALRAERLLLVDALLGTGLDRPLSPRYEEAAAWINDLRRTHPRSAVLAVDLPTGLDADTGRLWSAHTVRADVTLTLCAMKRGLVLDAGSVGGGVAGMVEIGSIGVPASLVRRVAGLDAGVAADKRSSTP